jgi:hypothetical protein
MLHLRRQHGTACLAKHWPYLLLPLQQGVTSDVPPQPLCLLVNVCLRLHLLALKPCSSSSSSKRQQQQARQQQQQAAAAAGGGSSSRRRQQQAAAAAAADGSSSSNSSSRRQPLRTLCAQINSCASIDSLR